MTANTVAEDRGQENDQAEQEDQQKEQEVTQGVKNSFRVLEDQLDKALKDIMDVDEVSLKHDFAEYFLRKQMATEGRILRVRVPPPPGGRPPPSPLSQPPPRGRIANIRVTSTMTDQKLALCIRQVLSSDGDRIDFGNGPLVGLFRESDGHFVSFEQMLSTFGDGNPVRGVPLQQQPQPQHPGQGAQNEIYSIHWVSSPSTTPPPSGGKLRWLVVFALLSLVLLSLVVLYYRESDIASWTAAVPIHPHRVFYETLEEFYLKGPWLGWNGVTLPTICVQITHLWDAEFWEGNIDECEDIILRKQEAWLQVMVPVVAISILVLFTLVCGGVVWVWWWQKKHSLKVPVGRAPTVHQDLVDPRRACEVLSKQFHQAASTMNASPSSLVLGQQLSPPLGHQQKEQQQ